MQTCEAPDFWGLHKNKNCAFPLRIMKLDLYYSITNKEDLIKMFDWNDNAQYTVKVNNMTTFSIVNVG